MVQHSLRYLLLNFYQSSNSNIRVAKIIAPSGNFEEIKHAGINLDVFGNVSIVTSLKYWDNDRQIVAMNFKYDGSLLKSTNIEDTNDIGMTAWTHQVDNSGDVIIPCNKQLPVQTYVARFENPDDLDEDSTKQALVTTSFSNAAYAVHNTNEI